MKNITNNTYNCKDLLDYWKLQYYDCFDEKYVSKNFLAELKLLKNLLNKYGRFVIFKATNKYFSSPKRNFSVFGFYKSFEYDFKDILKAKDILEYEIQIETVLYTDRQKVIDIINEYKEYCQFEILGDEEKRRKKEIEVELERIFSEHIKEG